MIYFVTDHLGSIRTTVGVTDSCYVVQQLEYTPGGAIWRSFDRHALQPKHFCGKEELTMHGYNMYDSGGRFHTNNGIRFVSLDPLAEKYYSWSPYAYCLGNPVNAIDPDGKLVIFINGFHFGDGGQKKYWGKNGIFADAVMDHLNDHTFLWRDGSVGGANNFINNQDSRKRKQYGILQARKDVDLIIKKITNSDGNIKETIKIITHSMGAAYAKGYVAELQRLFIKLGIPLDTIEFEADFAPYQPESQYAVVNPTYQFSHNKDGIAGNEKIPGAIIMDTESDKNQGHSIMDYYDQITNLPEGSYKFVNGEFVPN